LWAFNEEIVARAIFDSEIPIISAVGHEIDFTISDFVADLRAATPSAAMELATPSRDELFAFIDEFSYYFTQKISEIIADYKDDITQIISSYGFRLPQDVIRNKAQLLDNILYRFQNNFDNKLIVQKNRVELIHSKIESYNIDTTLKRGFVLVKQNEKIIPRILDLQDNVSIILKFYDGEKSLNND
jgi:exodeoxyribonuclease VII large subunit